MSGDRIDMSSPEGKPVKGKFEAVPPEAPPKPWEVDQEGPTPMAVELDRQTTEAQNVPTSAPLDPLATDEDLRPARVNAPRDVGQREEDLGAGADEDEIV